MSGVTGVLGKLFRRQREVTPEIEREILVGTIVSTRFLSQMANIHDAQRLFAVPYVQTVYGWVLGYWEQFREAPQGTIQDIFTAQSEELPREEQHLIERFLADLSVWYEANGETTYNVDYHYQKAVEYLEARGIEQTAVAAQAYLQAGDIDKAKQVMSGHNQITRQLAGWVDPFDNRYIKEVYDKEMNPMVEGQDGVDDTYLFRFPGALGRYMGPLRRGWLISFMGPMKRGKTWWLQECAIQAMLNGNNVLFISLEMPHESMAGRLYQRISALSPSGNAQCVIPTFDCVKNQQNVCTKRERVNRIKLVNSDGDKPLFTPTNPYRVCTACRNEMYSDYETEHWFEIVRKEKMTKRGVETQLRAFAGSGSFGMGKMRLISFPAYSANIQTINNQLRNLEYAEGFIPDVIIPDYADILAPEPDSRKMDTRGRLDETWKMLKNLAATRQALVITASQSTRATLNKKNVLSTDTAEDIRKLAHVDGMYTLNQTQQEKVQGVMRVGTAVHRWKKFDELSQVMVLQHLDLGQTVLDSEMIRVRKWGDDNPSGEDDE